MGLIYLDTCLLIYLLEDVPALGAQVRAAMQRQEQQEQQAPPPGGRFTISALVKLECLVAPIREGNLVLQRYYEDALAQLELLPMPEAVFIHAAHLRARFGLKTPDALHLACAQHHGCRALWTNDDRLAQAARGLAVKVAG